MIKRRVLKRMIRRRWFFRRPGNEETTGCPDVFRTGRPFGAATLLLPTSKLDNRLENQGFKWFH